MKPFKSPDLNAPRYKPKRTSVLGQAFYNRLRKENPELRGLSAHDFREIVSTFNELMMKAAIEHRDGIELPNQLGNIFLGRCLPKIRPNTDFGKSREEQARINHKNWDSSDFLLKIFYTNYSGSNRYGFRDREVWSFEASRTFSRSASEAFKNIWQRCIHIDHSLKIEKLFRQRVFKNKSKEYNDRVLDTYDEFEL